MQILKETYHFEDLGTDRKIILEYIFKKYGERVWADFIWLRTALSGWVYRIPVFSKGWEFLEQLNDYEPLKNDFTYTELLTYIRMYAAKLVIRK
jgi:hypothetical protein